MDACRHRHSLIVALGCSEQPTGPTAASAVLEQEPGGALRSDSAPAITAVRTITTRDRHGRPKAARRVVLKLGTVEQQGSRDEILWPALSDSAAMWNGSRLPVTLVRARAALAAGTCAMSRSWERETALGDLHIIARGRGSVPYSEVLVKRDGELIGTIKARWKRLPTSWVLVRQTATSADGRVTDDLEITHYDRRGPLDRLEVPEDACPPSQIRTILAEPNAPETRPLIGATLREGLRPSGSARDWTKIAQLVEGCAVPSDADLELGPCSAEMWARIAAGSVYAGASLTFVLACLTPEPTVSKVACVAASTAAAAALATFMEKQAKLDACKEKARKEAEARCICSPTASRRGSFADRTSPVPSRPGTPNALFLLEQSTDLDCSGGEGSPYPGGGDGGDGSTGDGGPSYIGLAVCVFEDHYDEQGNYMYSHTVSCEITVVQT